MTTAMEPTIKSSWLSFKQIAADFFRALPDANEVEADSGFKCMTLAYLGLDASADDQHQADLLMQIAGRKMIEHEVTLAASALSQTPKKSPQH